jgi:hypothetical protein
MPQSKEEYQMQKSKKHAPIQQSDEAMIDQLPKDKFEALILKLEPLASRAGSQQGSQPDLSQTVQELMDEHGMSREKAEAYAELI